MRYLHISRMMLFISLGRPITPCFDLDLQAGDIDFQAFLVIRTKSEPTL